MYAIKKFLYLSAFAVILSGGGGDVVDYDVYQNTHKIHISALESAPSYQLASITWLPDYKANEEIWGRYIISKNVGHNRGVEEENNCITAGYTVTSCPEGFFYKETELCPYSLDKKYYKACYSNDAVCIENGYTNSCGIGYEPDTAKVCSYNSSYTKCKPIECSGYEYTKAEANAVGYVEDGDPCQSGEELKYKRIPNPCLGFNYDSSNCGVYECAALDGETCQSGLVIKYKACKACASSKTECAVGQVNLDTYWCNGALKCWWK